LTITKSTPSKAILPDQINNLTVIANNTYFTFLINNQVVGYANDDHISKGLIGLAIQIHYAIEQATFEFDNFELREP